MSEYVPIIPTEDVGPYLRRVFLAKMKVHSPPWWAMMSAIKRVEEHLEEHSRVGFRTAHDIETLEEDVEDLKETVANLRAEICVLKTGKGA